MQHRRRAALKRFALGILGACWAFVSCAPLGRKSAASRPDVSPRSIDRLKADLATLTRPDYSEDAVPVLLVGENLAAQLTIPRSPSSESEGLRLAAEFQQITHAFRRVEPNPAPSHIPKLVEVLAHRDFGAAEVR